MRTLQQPTSQAMVALIKARDIHPGMTIVIIGNTTPWTITAKHPEHGRWWIHRTNAEGKWISSNAHYTEMKQVIK